MEIFGSRIKERLSDCTTPRYISLGLEILEFPPPCSCLLNPTFARSLKLGEFTALSGHLDQEKDTSQLAITPMRGSENVSGDNPPPLLDQRFPAKWALQGICCFFHNCQQRNDRICSFGTEG